MPRALLSVTDKTGITNFASELAGHYGFELVSTGGTARTLRDAGLAVTDVSDITGFPEMLDGRVKTLHPAIHGGILGDVRLESHRSAMQEHGIVPFDVVAVNLYAFEQTISGEHAPEEAIESIDIGGPALIRAAAKNHANVFVVVDPEDYVEVLDALVGDIEWSLPVRKWLAAKAFRHTAYYDSVIGRYLSRAAGLGEFSSTIALGLRQTLPLRYGENPHQKAALYVDPLGQPGIASAEQLWGKELSYNNLLDADAAWELVADMPQGSCAIIKHGNPCGAAVGDSFDEAYALAREADPISAFGGIAAFNGGIDEAAADAMTEKGNFLEVVIGTAFSEEALVVFQERAGWGQDVRLLVAKLPPRAPGLSIRGIRGGALIQEGDEDPPREFREVTDRKPTWEEGEALRLQWTIAQHVKSNAIVVGDRNRLFGVGAGQMNRVQSVRLALEQAGEKARGAVLASDAFFPFPDSVETASAAGIAAIVQPGGSKKDDAVIEAANRLGVAMVFTGVRHFRH